MTNFDASKIKWLLDELPKLQKEGVLDGDEAERLRSYYAPAGEPVVSPLRGYFLLALAVIGLLLVSGGVILIFADNWYLLPKQARLAAAFVPLAAAVCCGVFTICRGGDARWREASALFTATGFAVLLAIVSRVYNLGGSFAAYMEYLLLCSLPLVYVFDSQALAAACCCGLFPLLGGASLGARFLCLGCTMPYVLWKSFDLRGRTHSEWMRWLSLVPAAFFVAVSEKDFILNLTMSAFALLAAGLAAWDSEGRRANPWLAAGWLFAAALATAGGVSSSFWRGLTQAEADGWGTILLPGRGVWLLPFAACAVLTCLRRTGFSLLLFVFPLLAAAARLLPLPVSLFYRGGSVYAFVLGVALLAGGFKRRRLLLINAGAVQVLLLFFGKFITAAPGMITLGLIFIAAGAFFIVINLCLSRRFKAEEQKEAAP